VDTLKAIAVSFYTADELSVAKAKLQKTAKNVGQSSNQSIISLLTYDKTHMLTLNTELQYEKSQ